LIKQFKLMAGDRARRQRGSVLSGLLIIVAFLSILIGALMTELTTSFLVSRTHTARVSREATATSAVELAINRFQTRMVPNRCGTDRPDLAPVTLNGSSAAGTSSCTAILPADWIRLMTPASAVDGTHVIIPGRNSYLVGDQTGNLRSYNFGQSFAAWTIPVGGAVTGPPTAKVDPVEPGVFSVLVPTANPGAACGGHCVELVDDEGGSAAVICAMPASYTVSSRPAFEVAGVAGAAAVHFPRYTVFGDAGGYIYVFDADGGCVSRGVTTALGGGVVGDPLVFPGTVIPKNGSTTTSDEVFAVVAGSGTTRLVHWRYQEVVDSSGNTTARRLFEAELPRSISVGNATGYAISSTVPAMGSTLTMVFTGAGGNLAMATITVKSGPSYTMLGGSPVPLVLGGVGRGGPYWCHCPGQDLIGVGSTNGILYVLDRNLNLMWAYDGTVDGEPAINTTPAADANGNWYFGADDGYIYNVEPPAIGLQMFKAARVYAGGAISSSPVVGSEVDGCAKDARLNGFTPCMYFASSTSGLWFAKIGSTRLLDVRVSCVSMSSDPTTCVNPRLWAQVEVGSGVKVRGWSYYAP
jgi:hypothetical protein